MARGVEDVANAAGLAVILCNSDDRPDKEAAYLDLLAEQRVQGVLITPTAELSPHLEMLRGRGVPVVLLDRRAADADQCSVAVDDVLGGRLATEHLLERGTAGSRSWAARSGLPQMRERHDGVERRSGRRAGRTTRCWSLPPGAPTVTHGREAGRADPRAARRPPPHRRDLRQRPAGSRRPAGDGAPRRPGSRRLRDRRLRRHRLRRGRRRALSSVRKPRQELGRRAAELLHRRGPRRRTTCTSSWSSSRCSSCESPAWSAVPRADRRGDGMRVALFATCLVDTMVPQVARATAVLLRAAGPRGRRPAGPELLRPDARQHRLPPRGRARSSPTTCGPSRARRRSWRRPARAWPRSTTSRPPSRGGPASTRWPTRPRRWPSGPTSCRSSWSTSSASPTSGPTTRTA